MSRQAPLLRTREQAIGVKSARLAANTKRSLASIRERLSALFGPWAEIDNSVEGALEELLEAFGRFEKHVDGSVEWLKEPEEQA